MSPIPDLCSNHTLRNIIFITYCPVYHILMETLQQFVINDRPSLFAIVKYVLLAALEAIEALLLTYPLNLAIFALLLFFVVYRIVRILSPKAPFK